MAIDVNINDLPEGDGYSLAFRIAQSGAAVADVTVFSMRNTGTRKIKINRLVGNLIYSSGATSTLNKGYYLQLFSAATPSGGTPLTPAKLASTTPAAGVDARFLDTGLTTTNVVFGSTVMQFTRDTGFTYTSPFLLDFKDHPLELLVGEGIALRVSTVTSETGMGMSGTILFVEV